MGGFVALTKPRIIELLLITTVPTMVLAEKGWPSTWLVLVTLVGGTLAAGGANAINMVVDRDIDKLMPRTQNRPLVTGLVKPQEAMVFAIVLEVIAFAVLWRFANLLSAVLALSAMLFYVFVYTLWLKRTSTQNIVIGGAAGAVPVLGDVADVLWKSNTRNVDLLMEHRDATRPPREVPAEGMLGLRWYSSSGVTLTVGGGFGGNCSFGVPSTRFFTAVVWTPSTLREQEQIEQVIKLLQKVRPEGGGYRTSGRRPRRQISLEAKKRMSEAARRRWAAYRAAKAKSGKS